MSAEVVMFPLFQEAAGVDGQCDAGDVAGLVGGEEQHRVADVDGLHPRDRQEVERLADRREVVGPGFSRSGRNSR